MRRILLAIMLCCSLAMAAQSDDIKVKFAGARPTISDFTTSLIASYEDDLGEALGGFANAWEARQKGRRLPGNQTLTIDQKNGYVCFESRYEEDLLRIELCYWNESNPRYKILAYNISSFRNGESMLGQYDGIVFYRYDSNTRKMKTYYDINEKFSCANEDGINITYSLPQTGKDIIATTWYPSGKKSRVMKWNGHGF